MATPMPQTPIRVLVPAKDLPGEGHAEGAEQEEDAHDPRQLAGILVRPEEEDLDHVQRHHGHREGRAPEVCGAQEPAQRLLVVQVFQAGVHIGRRRNVDEGEAGR
jgi:hypothetical protein